MFLVFNSMLFSRLIKIFFLVLGLSAAITVSADIYKYVAPGGEIFYTDEPTHSQFKLIIRSRPKNYSKAYKRYKQNKKKYTSIIKVIAQKHNFDEHLIHAIIRAESAYDPLARSSAGAVGMMQLMPATAKRYGVTDRRDPTQNIDAGVRYMKDLLKMFNSNLKLAVAAYNAGENAVFKYKKTIPPYPETRKYVKRVLSFYNKAS